MAKKQIGKQSVAFEHPVHIISAATIVGDLEGNGPLKGCFDKVLEDDTWDEDSWEKAERKMFEYAVRTALQKCSLGVEDVNCLLGGDLLNQIITANFAARELAIPFLGLYGACSTMAESMLIGSMLIDGGFAQRIVCAATSHFSTAERQYRLPLEMGSQNTPTAQRTVTGAGCSVLSAEKEKNGLLSNLVITHGTIGRVVDLGITDSSNMGAAMAPAAVNTLRTHLSDTGRTVADYDLIITGDLGSFGSSMFRELLQDKGIELLDKHKDCGNMIFDKNQNVDCGGSGCGCSAAVMNAYLLHELEKGAYKRIFFMATGALMSPTAGMQGDSIPGIAHGVAIERRIV